MDHVLQVHRERKGMPVGSLDRETITEMSTKWFEMALPYLENPAVADGEKAKLRKDLDAVKWAGICLTRLVEHDELTPLTLEPDKKEMQGDPASGENDEAKRGETLESAGNERDLELAFAHVANQQPQSAEFEISGEQSQQPEPPAPPPLAPLSSSAQPDSEAEDFSTADLLDPRFVQTAEDFMHVCEHAGERLNEAQSMSEVARLGNLGEVLRALAGAIGLGKEFELLGKAMRFRAYYKAAQMGALREPGRPRNGVEPEPQPFTEYERKIMSWLSHLEFEDFARILEEAIKDGTLGEKTFKPGSPPKKKAPPEPEPAADPFRSFVSFAADLRINPEFYSQLNANRFVEDDRVWENLWPVLDRYVQFSIAIVGAMRARAAVMSEAEAPKA